MHASRRALSRPPWSSMVAVVIAIVVLTGVVVVAAPAGQAAALADDANQATAASTSVPDCPGEDSYGVASSNSTTGAKDYTCAQVRGSGVISVKPNASKTWTATAPYGYYRQDSSRWRSSSSIWWSEAEIATPIPKSSVSWSNTANNTVAHTRHFAVNVLWTAPAGYVPNMGSKRVLSGFYVIDSNSGAMPYLNPKWTNEELEEAADASARIYSDAGYKALYNTQDTPVNLATYCSMLKAGHATASLSTTQGDCAFVVCASPQPNPGPTLPEWCFHLVGPPKPTPYVGGAAPAASEAGEPVSDTDPPAGGINTPAGPLIDDLGGRDDAGGLLEARSSLADPPSLRCPAGSVPLFAEAVTFGFEEAPDPEVAFSDDGASIVALPDFAGVHAGLQLHCRDRDAGLEINGNVVHGSMGDDQVVSDLDEVLAMLGMGHDHMVANGRLAVLLGGLGDDRLEIHGDQAVARGGPGDDRIEAFGDDQLVIGGPGDDTLIGSTGPTIINALDGKGGDTIECRSPLNDVVHDPGDTLLGCGSTPAAMTTPRFTG